MEDIEISIFILGVFSGVVLRDAVRIMLVSAMSMPLAVTLALVLGPRGSTLADLGTAFWWYGAFLVGMLAGLAGLIAWSLVGRRIAVFPAKPVARVDR